MTGFIIALLIPLLYGGPVFAATQSITQEITVTAIVPAHRDIILDNSGKLIEIDSNTPEDIIPHAYRGMAAPANQVPLTRALMAEYRQIVPYGTTRSGVLFKLNPLAAITRRNTSHMTAATPSSPKDVDVSFLLRPRTTAWESMTAQNI